MQSKDFLKKLNLKFPLIVAPMAGGPSSHELVVASSEAGALGSIGAAYSAPNEIASFYAQVRAKTRNPLAINLFTPHQEPVLSEPQVAKAVQATEKYRKQFNLPKPALQPPYEENFDGQFEAVLKLRPQVLSFVFGLLPPEYVSAAKKENIYLIGTATTREEALALQESGVDAMTLQGFEAGGHRGLFNAASEDPEVTLKDLVTRCRPQIHLPLIAAGGLMSAQDVKAVLAQGADAVQMGTAFLACQEAGTSAPYRRTLLASANRKTKTTRVFSGRYARGIENLFMHEMEKQPEAILPFPAQNKFTRDLRKASAQNDSADFLSLWSGTGEGELWTGPAAELIRQLFRN